MVTLAIIGRPNVGKSTLFNRLATGAKADGRAIVDDRPGVTRDRREGAGALGGLSFMLMDTAGVEEGAAKAGALQGGMRDVTLAAMADADLLLLVYDARAGVTAGDESLALLARKAGKPVILLGNKCEGGGGDAGGKAADGIAEGHALGLGAPVAVSAAHGEGLTELHDAILAAAENTGHGAAILADGFAEAGESPQSESAMLADADVDIDIDMEADSDLDSNSAALAEKPIRLAVIGRPNMGKSTLVNNLLGRERVLTGDAPGVTRDAIAIPFTHADRDMILVDTAGMRRRSRITDRLERAMVADATRAIRFAHVCILMIDAREEMHKQDLEIARHVIDEGRAMVIAANMWDGVAGTARQGVLAELRYRLDKSLGQAGRIAALPVCALHGQGVDALMQAVHGAYGLWNTRIPTAEINRWLNVALEAHPPPLISGRRLRIRYATQVKTRPPGFALFASKPRDLPDHYLRYLEKNLRETFGLNGIPLRLMLRKGDNPYV